MLTFLTKLKSFIKSWADVIVGLCLLAVLLLAMHAIAAVNRPEVVIRSSMEKYEKAADKEIFLASVYNDIRDYDERNLDSDLRDFVIKVKVSQFCK